MARNGGEEQVVTEESVFLYPWGEGGPSHSPVDKNTDRIAVKSQCHGTGSGHRYTRREEGRGRLTGDEGEEEGNNDEEARRERISSFLYIRSVCFRSVESALFIIWDEGENGREKRDARHRNSRSGYPVPARMLPCHCLGHLGGFRTARTRHACVRVKASRMQPLVFRYYEIERQHSSRRVVARG